MFFKLVLFLLLSTISASSAVAVTMKNIDVGVFLFRLELRADNEVDSVNLDLIFIDFPADREIKVFDGLPITDTGQTFVAAQADINFLEASVLLTNGVSDSIKVLISQEPRAISIKGIEPFLLFGDYTGDNGIDLTGLIIESIELQITNTEFEYGIDPEQGSFTDIAVEGEVTVQPGPLPISLIAGSFGSSRLDNNYSLFSDADGDGDVDGSDLSIIY
jgi:hypothetical protein